MGVGNARNIIAYSLCYMYLLYPDIQSMWSYIIFAFPFVCLFVCMYVCSSLQHIRGRRVKDFALKFIRPHIEDSDGFHSYLA